MYSIYQIVNDYQIGLISLSTAITLLRAKHHYGPEEAKNMLLNSFLLLYVRLLCMLVVLVLIE